MSLPDSESYTSLEDFMSEDKLPPVFPSSQSSNVSETQVYSQHLISAVCDNEACGPFGIETNDSVLPLNFLYSSLAYSPKSMPPFSPSDDRPAFNFPSPDCSILDPSDLATGDDILKNLENLNTNAIDKFADNANASKSMEITLPDNDVILQNLDDLKQKSDLESANYTLRVAQPPTYSMTPSLTPIPEETPSTPLNRSESSDSICLTQSIPSTDSTHPVKKPSTRGRKRKLFTEGGVKKKDQNREAARRYREKKKSENAQYEAEEKELLEKNRKLHKQLEMIQNIHREFTQTFRQARIERRQK